MPLVLGEEGVQGQLGHAEDGVHGGADLVADVGQELVLGSVRPSRSCISGILHNSSQAWVVFAPWGESKRRISQLLSCNGARKPGACVINSLHVRLWDSRERIYGVYITPEVNNRWTAIFNSDTEPQEDLRGGK